MRSFYLLFTKWLNRLIGGRGFFVQGLRKVVSRDQDMAGYTPADLGILAGVRLCLFYTNRIINGLKTDAKARVTAIPMNSQYLAFSPVSNVGLKYLSTLLSRYISSKPSIIFVEFSLLVIRVYPKIHLKWL